MTREFDVVDGSAPLAYAPVVRCRVVLDLGASERLADADAYERPAGALALLMRRRAGRRAGTMVVHRGAWHRVVGVTAEPGSRVLVKVQLEPAEPAGEVLARIACGANLLAADGAPVLA